MKRFTGTDLSRDINGDVVLHLRSEELCRWSAEEFRRQNDDQMRRSLMSAALLAVYRAGIEKGKHEVREALGIKEG